MITQQVAIKRIKGLIRKAEAPWCVFCKLRMRHGSHKKRGDAFWQCGQCSKSCMARSVALHPTDPYCVYCRRRMSRQGKWKELHRYWFCRGCGVHYSGGARIRQMSVANRLNEIVILVEQGKFGIEIAGMLGMSNTSASKYRKMIIGSGAKCPPACRCGKPFGHTGGCRWVITHPKMCIKT